MKGFKFVGGMIVMYAIVAAMLALFRYTFGLSYPITPGSVLAGWALAIILLFLFYLLKET